MSYRILKTNVLASALALSVMSVACDRSPIFDPPFQPPPPPGEVNYTVSGSVTAMIDGSALNAPRFTC